MLKFKNEVLTVIAFNHGRGAERAPKTRRFLRYLNLQLVSNIATYLVARLPQNIPKFFFPPARIS